MKIPKRKSNDTNPERKTRIEYIKEGTVYGKVQICCRACQNFFYASWHKVKSEILHRCCKRHRYSSTMDQHSAQSGDGIL